MCVCVCVCTARETQAGRQQSWRDRQTDSETEWGRPILKRNRAASPPSTETETRHSLVEKRRTEETDREETDKKD